MNKTELVSLEVSHFRSVRDVMRVEFDKLGLWQITAINHDTKGSSGAGKSTVLLGLNAALDCAPYPMTELQNWDSKDPVLVKLELRSSKYGKVVRTVGAKNRLEVEGESTITSAKKIAEKMQQILGVSPEVVAALTYRQQQVPTDFLTMPNAAKQDFLATVLGLQRFERAIEVGNKNCERLVEEQNRAIFNVDVAKRAGEMSEEALKHWFMANGDAPPNADKSQLLAVLEKEHQELLHEQTQWDEETVAPNTAAWNQRNDEEWAKRMSASGMTDQVSAAQARVQREKADLVKVQASFSEVNDEQLNQLMSYLKLGKTKLLEVEAAERKRIEDRQMKLRQYDVQILTAQQLVREATTHELQLKTKAGQIVRAEADTCPTCEQTWAKSKDLIPKLNSEIEAHRAKLTAAVIAEADVRSFTQQKKLLLEERPDPVLDQMKSAVANLEQQIAVRTLVVREGQQTAWTTLSANLRSAEAELQVLYTAQTALRTEIDNAFRNEYQSHQNLKAKFMLKLTANEADIRATKAEQAAAVQRQEIYFRDRARLMADVEKKHGECDQAVAAVEKFEEAINSEKDFAKLMGREGFMGLIFDEIIAEIAAETNTILGRVANTSNVVLDFRSELTPSGKPEIRSIVTVGGHEWPMRSGCSGGMWSALRLAVHIARRRVLARRTGMDLCWLGLDEPFDGMDEVSKEPAMEILAEAAKDCLIFVVDHSERFKSLFSKQLKLEYKAGTTQLI